MSSNQPTRFRAPFGLDPGSPNDVRSWSEFRGADFFNLGLTVGYDFYGLARQHIILSGTITNILDLSTETGINRTDNNNFGTVSARQAGRRVQLGIQYKY